MMNATWKSRLSESTARLKNETLALYFAWRDPRLPWYARVFMGFVLAYAFSPIDLIPDFIPVLGYLDDLVIVPLGIALAMKMVPHEVMEAARQKASEYGSQAKPVTWIGAVIIVLIWLAALALTGWLIFGLVRGNGK